MSTQTQTILSIPFGPSEVRTQSESAIVMALNTLCRNDVAHSHLDWLLLVFELTGVGCLDCHGFLKKNRLLQPHPYDGAVSSFLYQTTAPRNLE